MFAINSVFSGRSPFKEKSKIKSTPKKIKKSNYSAVVEINKMTSTMNFFTMKDGNEDNIQLDSKKFKEKFYSEEFYGTFKEYLEEFALTNGGAVTEGIAIVLPDFSVSTDSISIPTLKRLDTEKSLDVSISDLYKNVKDLQVNYIVTSSNKQFTTFGLTMMQHAIINKFNAICAECKVSLQAITFNSNAIAAAVQTINPKLHASNYVFLDIKNEYSDIVFVNKGSTCGFYSLPFGYSILEHNKLASEDMLFDHRKSELMVLNAKEKAKAKALTMMQNNDVTDVAEDEEVSDGNISNEIDENEEESIVNDKFQPQVIKTLPKKTPRKLPQFMQRPIPHSDEEYLFENFRIFVKWVLNLIQTNGKTFWQDHPEAVYVNMPSDFHYILDKVNEESVDNKILFFPLDVTSTSIKISECLQCYGGLSVTRFGSRNIF